MKTLEARAPLQHMEEPYRFDKILGYINRADELLSQYEIAQGNPPFPPWSLLRLSEKAVKENKQLSGSSPIGALDNYWQKVVTPTAQVVNSGFGSADDIIDLTGKDLILLSANLQRRFPHSSANNLAVGSYIGKRINHAIEDRTESTLPYTVLELLKQIQPYEHYWHDMEDKENFMIAFILVKGGFAAKQKHDELEIIADELHKRIEYAIDIGWVFLPHVSIVKALEIISGNKAGRQRLKEHQKDYQLKSMSIKSLEYVIEQLSLNRQSRKQNMRPAFANAKKRSTPKTI